MALKKAKRHFYIQKTSFTYFFLYRHSIEKVRFAKFENGLVVDHKIRQWGFALVAGGLDKGRATSFYKIVK